MTKKMTAIVISVVVAFVLTLAAGFVGGKSCAPKVVQPDEPIPPATMPDAGAREAVIDAELQRRLEAIEGRMSEIEAEQARRRVTFTRSQRDELDRVRDGGRGAVAEWLNDFDMGPTRPSSPPSSP